MSSTIQRAELQSQIWKIANEVRGAVDGWDFKQYVLGTLFYRFISENITSFIEAKSLYKQDPLEINLNDFTKAIFNIYEAIEMISKQGILTYDMMFNILYNQDFFIIDHDEYMFKDLDWQILNKENKKNFNMELFYFLIDGYFDEFIKKYPLLKKMYKEKEIDILDFLKLFRNKLSEIIGLEIKCLNEAQKLINKKKTKTTIYPRKIDK